MTTNYLKTVGLFIQLRGRQMNMEGCPIQLAQSSHSIHPSHIARNLKETTTARGFSSYFFIAISQSVNCLQEVTNLNSYCAQQPRPHKRHKCQQNHLPLPTGGQSANDYLTKSYKGSFRYVFVVTSLCVFRQKLVTPPTRAHCMSNGSGWCLRKKEITSYLQTQH